MKIRPPSPVELEGFTASDIKEILRIPNLVTIANDYRAVNMAMNQGRPLLLAMPGTPILRDIDALVHAPLGLERRKTSGNRLFGRVLEALKR